MAGKQFTTYEEQIDFLKSDKGLTITDEASAIQILKKESYFALINGYKELFKRPENKKLYISGATFNDIYALYKFDERIRLIFLKYILVIERHIKSLISYEFSLKYGNEQIAYFNANNYKYTAENLENTNKFLNKLSGIYKHSLEHKYIKHYCDKHKNVPLWVLMNVLTFGQVSQMFQCLTDSLQTSISKNFSCLRRNQVENMLIFITFFRNVCAHNERLFNFTVSKRFIPNMYIHKYMKCVDQKGRNDLFALVICFKYMLDDDDFNDFSSELQGAMDRYKSESQVLSKQKLLQQMGFPQDWMRILKAPYQEPPNLSNFRQSNLIN